MVYCVAGVVSIAAEYTRSYVDTLVTANPPTETLAHHGEVRRVTINDMA